MRVAGSNAISESTGESISQGRSGQEDPDPETELMAEIEEGQEVGYARAKTRFRHAKQEPAGHFPGPCSCGCLESRNDTPTNASASDSRRASNCQAAPVGHSNGLEQKNI